MRWRKTRHVAAFEHDGTGVGPNVATNHGEHGCLASAVRPDHPKNAALRDVQINILGNNDRTYSFL
jgi:hypothetical protein